MIATIVISSITFVSIILSILLFPSIKIGKIKISTYWVIALLGAIILLSSSLSPINEVYNQLTSDAAINPLKIIVLFFSMTFLSIFLDEVGLFRYLAKIAVKRAGNSQYVLFFILYGLTSLLTVFTSNDIVILTLTPFICFFCKNAKINPLPYLIAEFAAANTWSMMFIIGNPTNIYLATSANINFIDYFKVMAIPTIASGLVELFIIFLLFNKQLKAKIEVIKDDYEISNKVDLWVGIAHLSICVVLLVISSYINLEMWLVSLISATSLLMYIFVSRLINQKDWVTVSKSIKRLPYPLIPFFLSMFVVVVSWNYQGVSLELSKIMQNGPSIIIYGSSSFIASNVINNIPMSILFSNFTCGYESIFATIIGSNIGAFLTPLGALAGIMFSSLLSKYEVKYSFLDFVKYGIIISIPTIATALLTLWGTVNFIY